MTLLALALVGGWWIWYAVRLDAERRAIRQRLTRYVGLVEAQDMGRMPPVPVSEAPVRASV